MVIQNSEGNDEIHPNISRRTLLKESLALAVLSSASRTLLGSVGGGVSQKIFAYVGTYSEAGDRPAAMERESTSLR